MGCRSCGAGWFSAILAALAPERSTSLIQQPGLDHCLPVATIESVLSHPADVSTPVEQAMAVSATGAVVSLVWTWLRRLAPLVESRMRLQAAHSRAI
jgi:hypothetical protein